VISRLGVLVVVALSAAGPLYAQDTTAGGKKATEVCAACHGPNGNSSQGIYPSLAGQTARYIYLQLKDFNEGRRSDSLMTPVAKTLTKDDMLNVAAYFAAQELRPTDFNADPARGTGPAGLVTAILKGSTKAAETLCTMCHGTGFRGQNEVPRLAGQQHDYIVKQLKDFKEGKRTNDAGNMAAVSKTLSDEDIENLAAYLANLR
jgi:cytochrome c553